MKDQLQTGGTAMNPKCTSCNQTMQFIGEVAQIESYWCEDCDIEGHINLRQVA